MLRGQLSFDCSALDFISTGNVPCRHAGRLCLENELTFSLLIARGDCLKMLEEREAIAVVRAAGQRRLNYIHTNRCARKINDKKKKTIRSCMTVCNKLLVVNK